MRLPNLFPLALAALACAGEPADDPGAAESAPEDEAPAVSRTAPDTTPEAVWARLVDTDYASWALWPGKGRLYAGTEPHGALLTTYVNDLAREALTSGTTEMPDGAIVVKDNHGPDGTLMAHTVMLKARGYDAEHGDWFWAKYGPDGEVEASGRVASCAECHATAADDDYLITRMQGRDGAGGMGESAGTAGSDGN